MQAIARTYTANPEKKQRRSVQPNKGGSVHGVSAMGAEATGEKQNARQGQGGHRTRVQTKTISSQHDDEHVQGISKKEYVVLCSVGSKYSYSGIGSWGRYVRTRREISCYTTPFDVANHGTFRPARKLIPNAADIPSTAAGDTPAVMHAALDPSFKTKALAYTNKRAKRATCHCERLVIPIVRRNRFVRMYRARFFVFTR